MQSLETMYMLAFNQCMPDLKVSQITATNRDENKFSKVASQMSDQLDG